MDGSKTQRLLEASAPVTPSACVRILVFWFPMAFVVTLFTLLFTFSAFQELALGWKIFGYIFGFLAALIFSGYIAAPWQLKPLPTQTQLAEIGGKYFVRPSDGKFLEYFIAGAVGSKSVVVFLHRMDGKAGADYGRTSVGEVLNAQSACLLSVSVPSLSASEPYDTCNPVQWLQQFDQDMVALLHDLGAEHVYVLGLSWAAQLAANLALALQKKGLLRGVAPIGGQMWDTKTQNFPIEETSPWVPRIFSKPYLVRPLAYLLIKNVMPSSWEVIEKQMRQGMSEEKANTEIDNLKKYAGDVDAFAAGFPRSMAYFLHQNWQVGATCSSRVADEYVDFNEFDPSIPFYLYIGKSDGLTAQIQQVVHGLVKHSVIKEYEGTHSGFPLADIIKELFATQV